MRTCVCTSLIVALVLFGLAPAAIAQGPTIQSSGLTSGGLRAPSTPQALGARIPKSGKQFDGFASTDYFGISRDFTNPANPDIAVGPDDILIVAGNRRIARIPNPNSFDNQVNFPFDPTKRGGDNYAALKASTAVQEVDLDTWLGQTNLNLMCPGQFNPGTCLISHPVVRYDQLQGRFLVAFSVIDTGVRGNDIIVTQPRRATWVLIVSKFATFSPNTLPSNTTQVFTTPIQPATGGIATANWTVYFGGTTNSGGMLDINRYSTHPAADPIGAPGAFSANFPVSDCTVATVPAAPIDPAAAPVPGPVCYFPTEVRLGIDNDSIILVSPVVDVNQTLIGSNTKLGTTGPFAGNRVRVLSKRSGVYSGSTLTNGNTITPPAFVAPAIGTPPPPPVATQWDIFRDVDTQYAAPSRRYTLGLEFTTASTIPDVHYYLEPVHLRGRALASYSNYPFAGQTVLIGSRGPALAAAFTLYLQQIGYRSDYVPILTGAAAQQILVPDAVQAPRPVRQNTTCSTTPCNATPPTPQTSFDLYVGDARPQKAIFREGHVYDARVGQDQPFGNNLASGGAVLSTVFYDVVQMRQPIPSFSFTNGNLVSIVDAGNTSTVTTTVPHGLVVGSIVTISGATVDTDLNKQYAVIAVPTPVTFQVTTANVTDATYTEPTLTVSVASFIPAVLMGPAAPVTPSNVLYTKWQNGHFYAPMFDVPANVLQSGPVSPINLLPYFDKLFVGTTSPRFGAPSVSTEGNVWPSLFDVRQGQDRFEQYIAFQNPHTGQHADPNNPQLQLTNVMTIRGGAATDPNFGGLWVYGTFGTFRLAGNVGEWGTNAAYYEMSFPATDPYNTGSIYFADVPATHDFFRYIQSARNIGLDQFLTPPPPAQSAIHGSDSTLPNFLPDQKVTRKEMAAFIINSQMDPAAIDHFLSNTAPGGGPCPATMGANVCLTTSSFADVPAGGGNGVSAAQQKAIEVMYRRGYTRGCGLTNDGTFAFCPNDLTTRAQMAVFVVRAKFGNVFPTVFSGCSVSAIPGCSGAGDNFGLFLPTTPYFPGDTPTTHPFFIYIQKLRELRITNGLTTTTYGTCADFSCDNDPNNSATKLTRGQMATFIVRAFFF
jgi:hypothetical protein